MIITGMLPALGSKYDPRIASIGKFLRKTNLVELPQLIQFLKVRGRLK